MLIASGFSWFHLLIPGVDGSEHGVALAGAWLVTLVLIVFAVVARMGLERARARNGLEAFQADETLTARNAAEIFLEGIQGMMSDVLERRDVRTFFPLIGALFAYIFVGNLMALLPGFQPPTDNINTNVGMALIVFFTFNAVGLSRDAVGYIKHLMGPVLFVAWLIFPIEFVGLFVRPLSLSVRLTGNIFGDHAVFNIMSELVPIGVPVIFLALGLLVSVIQAFVFSLLSTIYISLSVPHGDHHDDH